MMTWPYAMPPLRNACRRLQQAEATQRCRIAFVADSGDTNIRAIPQVGIYADVAA